MGMLRTLRVTEQRSVAVRAAHDDPSWKSNTAQHRKKRAGTWPCDLS